MDLVIKLSHRSLSERDATDIVDAVVIFAWFKGIPDASAQLIPLFADRASVSALLHLLPHKAFVPKYARLPLLEMVAARTDLTQAQRDLIARLRVILA
jgi:hypothetical protein